MTRRCSGLPVLLAGDAQFLETLAQDQHDDNRDSGGNTQPRGDSVGEEHCCLSSWCQCLPELSRSGHLVCPRAAVRVFGSVALAAGDHLGSLMLSGARLLAVGARLLAAGGWWRRRPPE